MTERQMILAPLTVSGEPITAADMWKKNKNCQFRFCQFNPGHPFLLLSGWRFFWLSCFHGPRTFLQHHKARSFQPEQAAQYVVIVQLITQPKTLPMLLANCSQIGHLGGTTGAPEPTHPRSKTGSPQLNPATHQTLFCHPNVTKKARQLNFLS